MERDTGTMSEHPGERGEDSDVRTGWRMTPTLSDAPLQLREDVNQQDLAEWLVELSEDVADGVQGVVTRGCHPLGFLRADEQLVRRLTSKATSYDDFCHLTLTSVCCSGSFMLSKMRKTILKRSCHQCFSKVWP